MPRGEIPQEALHGIIRRGCISGHVGAGEAGNRAPGMGSDWRCSCEATPPLAQPALGRGGSTARAGNTPSFSGPRGGSGQQAPYHRTPAPLLGQPTRHRMHEQDPGGGPQMHSPGVPSTLRCSLPKAPQTHGGSQDNPFPQLDKKRPLGLQSSPFLVPRTWARNGEATCLKPHNKPAAQFCAQNAHQASSVLLFLPLLCFGRSQGPWDFCLTGNQPFPESAGSPNHKPPANQTSLLLFLQEGRERAQGLPGNSCAWYLSCILVRPQPCVPSLHPPPS